MPASHGNGAVCNSPVAEAVWHQTRKTDFFDKGAGLDNPCSGQKTYSTTSGKNYDSVSVWLQTRNMSFWRLEWTLSVMTEQKTTPDAGSQQTEAIPRQGFACKSLSGNLEFLFTH